MAQTVNFKIPPVLRNLVGGQKQISVDVDGTSVGEALTALDAKHPGFRSQILDENGGIARYVNVYLNDEDVRYLQGSATQVGAGDTLVILPAMSGGAEA